MRNNTFGYLIVSTLISGVFIPVSFAQSNGSNSSLVCATRPEVIIRDFYTGNAVGQLEQGECMSAVPNIQHYDLVIRAQYLTVRNGKSGKLRLVSKQFVVYSDN